MNNAKENKTQICIFCAEEIKIDAIVCKHCGAEYEKTVKGIDHWVREGVAGNNNTKWDIFWNSIGFAFILFFILVIFL